MPTAGRAESPYERLVPLAAAVCLFLASVEYLIPRPLPFLRLGLSNLPFLVTLDLLPAGPFLMLLGLKAAGQGLVQGTLFSVTFLFSAAGSLASGAVMYAARRLAGRRISLIGVSILGAMASNLVQLVMASRLVFGPYAWVIAPPFLAVGLATSTALGALAQRYVQRSAWLAGVARSISAWRAAGGR